MTVAVSFEPMVAADLPQVLEIERLVFESPWSAGLFLHELKLPFSRSRVARVANGGRTVVGYACWWIVGDEVHILNLAVHPDYRRRGIGHAMVQLVLDDAAQQGAASVSLEVRRENEPAQHLYRAFGFTEAGVRRNYYGPGKDAIIMTCVLADRRPVPHG